MAVLGDVEGFVVVEEFEDVGGRGSVDDGGGDELVHGFVGGGVGGVIEEAGAAGGDGAGEEGYADRTLLGDALEGADEVGTLEVLRLGVNAKSRRIALLKERETRVAYL